MKLSAFLFAVLTACGPTFGQSADKLEVAEPGAVTSFPIDGTPLLKKQYHDAVNYALTHPEILDRQAPRKTSANGFSEGDAHTWWVLNIETDLYYQDKSTCRAVGKNCYIFVEDSLWNVRVTQAAVDSIVNDFDNRTPADPTRGIFTMDTSAFGNPPDVDGDPRIILLICNVQDGFSGSGGYVQGFFDPSQEVPGSHSNYAEIYYLDANPTDLTKANGIRSAMATAAHEFQHMINYNYHRTSIEPTFINESCSKLAEIYCGYPASDLSLYANETNHYLFDWRTYDNTLVLNDYSRAQRFSLYLWDRFGIAIFRYIVQSRQISEIAILNDALSKAEVPLTFDELFTDWLIANVMNDTSSNRLYGYAYPNLPASNGKLLYNPNTAGTGAVQRVGAQYLTFAGGSDLSATFQNTDNNANLSVIAVERGDGTDRVVPVVFGSRFYEPGYGITYSSICFAVINRDPHDSVKFSYDASGNVPTTAMELKYDDLEPLGSYAWAPLDTVCVTFEAYQDGILDSIRVALKNSGSMEGGIYKFTGSQNPTPLGQLLVPITVSISTSSANPYPVPFNNWATVDLTSQSISTDKPFAVAFVMGNNPGIPGVMYTNYPGQKAYHSYTWVDSARAYPHPPGWYYITRGDSAVAIYLVRAYVSVSTGTKEVVELTPKGFALEQNYPNPFNPSTIIRFSIPGSGFVSLKVYDVLGRMVRTLVSEVKHQGSYEVAFNAGDLPSGVYFYRLSVRSILGREVNFSQVRKLVLIR